MTTSGQGRAGALTIINTRIIPQRAQQYEIANARTIWALSAKKTQGVSLADSDTFDKYLIAGIDDQDGSARSRVFAINAEGIEEVQNTDFDPDAGSAVEVGVLNGGTRIAQVLPTEVRTFDAGEASFSLSFTHRSAL